MRGGNGFRKLVFLTKFVDFFEVPVPFLDFLPPLNLKDDRTLILGSESVYPARLDHDRSGNT